jgi:hypothetical protein
MTVVAITFFYSGVIEKKKKKTMTIFVTFFDGFVAKKGNNFFDGFVAKKVMATMSSLSSMVVVL